MIESARIATVEEFTHAVINIVRTVTIRNGEEWTPYDQIKQIIASRDASILQDCADRAVAQFMREAAKCGDGVDEIPAIKALREKQCARLRAAIVGKEKQG